MVTTEKKHIGEAVMKTVLRAENIYKDYRTGERIVHAVRPVSLAIEEGRFYAIVGRSGSGKTTLLHLLSSLEAPDGGEIWLEGEAYGSLDSGKRAVLRRKKIGIVFQEYNLLPELSVYENIILPVLLDGKKADEAYISSLMEMLEIGDLKDSYPHQLSGGEIQRTAIARAMANRPQILFADEPTGQLDEASSFQVIKLLKESNKKYGQTILMVTHDKQMAQYADEILVLADGKIV